MKIFHFHLEDSLIGKSTLICELIDGSIIYRFFTGTASSGSSLALDNLQVGFKFGGSLPVDNKRRLSKREFTDFVKTLINTDSVYRVINEVETEVKFD
jgi:hypothetical protein